MPRLLVDLKTNCRGEIAGRIDLPADSAFVLECLSEVIRRFSDNCEVPVPEILNDILNLSLRMETL